jgi:hypothetical protein
VLSADKQAELEALIDANWMAPRSAPTPVHENFDDAGKRMDLLRHAQASDAAMKCDLRASDA